MTTFETVTTALNEVAVIETTLRLVVTPRVTTDGGNARFKVVLFDQPYGDLPSHVGRLGI